MKKDNTIIFCISVNCSKITAVMLKSFHKHHQHTFNGKIHIFGTLKDFAELNELVPHSNNIFVDISGNTELVEKFKQGHSGTTYIFAQVIAGQYGQFDRFIHIDGDIFFKRESISVIEYAFDEGYDIVGTRRCYGNNPSGIKGLEIYPDTISTFFFGMKIPCIPAYPFEKLYRYCAGAEHPLGWIVLDCFDGVTHGALNNGAKIKFLGQDEFGSQDINGSKVSGFKSNMHLDIGSHIAHFGGVGSGYAYCHGSSKPELGYAKWAVGRWALFSELFYSQKVDHNEPTVYGEDGRWINGNYDENIINQLLIDLKN